MTPERKPNQKEIRELSRRELLGGAIITGGGGLVGGASLVDMYSHEKQSLLRFLLDDVGFSAGVVIATLGIMSMATSRDYGQNEKSLIEQHLEHRSFPPTEKKE